ncbi:S-adenosyl-L-methionine-dependent methyltransferase [Patellaria atrata CBS 101060]|uniref:tRNA (uracil(54)-C(5))-methyltransferase n=1 Tax=Patellaria atrata CBS 101060 TaxID=1346257 RepID=A0A9P4SI59_9PEZI|nr:S-adenosyl-L-methionine-dependent methyltransferase [Patellaria atrata CBS 101060]
MDSVEKTNSVFPNASKKRSFNEGKRHFKKNKKQKGNPLGTEGSNEEVLLADIRALLQRQTLNDTSASDSTQALPELFAELDVTVSEISSTGDGLAFAPNTKHVYVVPFTAPGDTVTAKIYKQFHDESYSLADFVKVVTPSTHRDSSLVRCPYFSTCSGCQFQMLPYEYQLNHKKTIVEKAYRNFSKLKAELIPPVGNTIGSPLQYGYRTKLTPHFDGPPDAKHSDGRNGIRRTFKEVPPIGYMKKGTRTTIDIEECPIGTEAVQMGLRRERRKVAENLQKYSRGVTILLRESTKRIPNDALSGADSKSSTTDTDDVILEDRGPHIHQKNCISDQNAVSTEYVDDFVFTNPAGSFFQNNNSILPVFTQYIRDNILPKDASENKITNLIDAYSGSGLFTVTLSSMFKKSLGIDVAAKSIEFASKNARLNGLDASRASFIAADAADLFAKIDFPGDETAVVIDPSRKGCDESFLRQLLRYSPARIVYVSCNVHTQARDVGFLVRGMDGVDGGFGAGKGAYEIESLIGFDFFPQTGHVEGVAVLKRKVTRKREN